MPFGKVRWKFEAAVAASTKFSLQHSLHPAVNLEQFAVAIFWCCEKGTALMVHFKLGIILGIMV